MVLPHPGGELEPAFVRQCGRAEDNIDLLPGRADELPSFRPIDAFNHMVAAVSQIFGKRGANENVLLDDQDRFHPRWPNPAAGRRADLGSTRPHSSSRKVSPTKVPKAARFVRRDIARGDNDGQGRAYRTQLSDEIQPVQLTWHLHVREDEIDLLTGSEQQGGFVGTRRFHDGEARGSQLLDDQQAEQDLVSTTRTLARLVANAKSGSIAALPADGQILRCTTEKIMPTGEELLLDEEIS